MNLLDEAFVWFTDFDVEIVGDDICSKCRKTIVDEVPLMIFRQRIGMMGKGSVDVARFHFECASDLIAAGVLRFT
jgi:hypothetical protein